MLNINEEVYFLYADGLRTGRVTAIRSEQTSENIKVVEFSVEARYATFTVDARRVSNTPEGVFQMLLEDYQASIQPVEKPKKATSGLTVMLKGSDLKVALDRANRSESAHGH